MGLFKNRMTDEAARRIANHGLNDMGFFNPEKEVDINFVSNYMTQVILDYDELIAGVEKRSMVKGALLMAGALYVVKKLTEDKVEEA